MTLIPFEFWKKYFNIWLHGFCKEANSSDDHETASRYSCTNLKYKVSATCVFFHELHSKFQEKIWHKIHEKMDFLFFARFLFFLFYIYRINSTLMPLIVLNCVQCVLATQFHWNWMRFGFFRTKTKSGDFWYSWIVWILNSKYFL